MDIHPCATLVMKLKDSDFGSKDFGKIGLRGSHTISGITL